MVLKGFLVSRRVDGTYIAPLIPQLFYGADGKQLTTWRQYLPTAGSQVILSRAAGGYPKVPRQELYWRKVSDFEEEAVPTPTVAKPTLQLPSWVLPVGILAVGAIVLILLARK